MFRALGLGEAFGSGSSGSIWGFGLGSLVYSSNFRVRDLRFKVIGGGAGASDALLACRDIFGPAQGRHRPIVFIESYASTR